MRSITTNLQYLSKYNYIENNKALFMELLQKPIENKNFCVFGDQGITDAMQLNAIKTHLHSIQQMLQEQYLKGTHE